MDETVSRPSRFSKVRVLRGVSRRATTRTRRVAAWMAGQFTGSRRSRRSWFGFGHGQHEPLFFFFGFFLVLFCFVYLKQVVSFGGVGGERGVVVHTFMLCSREKRSLEGGWRRRTPCSESRALSMSRSMLPSSLLASSRSRVWIRRVAMFHWNPSCSLKNSRKAASPLRSESGNVGDLSFVGVCGGGGVGDCRCCCCGLVGDADRERDLLVLFLFAACADRQIWARRPSTCFRPFLTFGPSYEARLSNATERSVSIVGVLFLFFLFCFLVVGNKALFCCLLGSLGFRVWMQSK
jgi:hypothetical protein